MTPTMIVNKKFSLHLLAKRSGRYYTLFIGVGILLCSGVGFLYCCLDKAENRRRKPKPMRRAKMEKKL